MCTFKGSLTRDGCSSLQLLSPSIYKTEIFCKSSPAGTQFLLFPNLVSSSLQLLSPSIYKTKIFCKSSHAGTQFLLFTNLGCSSLPLLSLSICIKLKSAVKVVLLAHNSYSFLIYVAFSSCSYAPISGNCPTSGSASIFMQCQGQESSTPAFLFFIASRVFHFLWIFQRLFPFL